MLEILGLPRLNRCIQADRVQPNSYMCWFGTSKQCSYKCLPFSKLPLQAQLPAVKALVPQFLPHTLLQWSPEPGFCFVAYFGTCYILRRQENKARCSTHAFWSLPFPILSSLFAKTVVTLRSLGKISLDHILFAIAKELLKVSWAQDLLCILWWKNCKRESCFLGFIG